MRTWVKATLGGVAVLALGFGILAGTGAYYVFRNLDTRTAAEADAQADFQAIRTRFGARPPLIDVTDPRAMDLRINRPAEPDGRAISTVHVLVWEAEDHRVLKTATPVWLMRFTSFNVLSQLGITPERFRLTVQDLERYGPGVVVDFSRPGRSRLLIWVD